MGGGPVAGSGSARANTFFALVPPAPLRRAITSFQARLTPGLEAGARPVPPDNFHVTLAFLGAVEERQLPALTEVGDAMELPAARLRLDQFGTFPGARVGWLGVSDLPQPLARFQDQLCAALRGAGFTPDQRAWVPHLTLYRKLRKASARVVPELPEWTVDGFELLRTTPTKQGPSYRSKGAWRARRTGL